jgi:transcriptional regulator with XRE-family HTH domain
LRRLRESREYTADEVAERLRWSPSKLSRIENARIGVQVSDVLLLVEFYRVDEKHAGELIELSRAAAEPGWWAEYRQDITEPFAAFIALEDEADSALDYQSYLVPGLLQTREYAEHVIRSYNAVEKLSGRRIGRRVEVRMIRQRILSRSSPLKLSLVLDESALMRNVGGAGVMHRQLLSLARSTRLPNVTLRILPLESEREPIIAESFVLLRYSSAFDVRFPDVAHVDTFSTIEIQDDHMTGIYRGIWERLAAAALEPAPSLRHILALAKTYEPYIDRRPAFPPAPRVPREAGPEHQPAE